MSDEIEFSQEEKTVLAEQLQYYFMKNLSHELERFDAEFLLEFITEKMGVVFYNRGVSDAQVSVAKIVEDINDALYMLEKPIPDRRS